MAEFVKTRKSKPAPLVIQNSNFNDNNIDGGKLEKLPALHHSTKYHIKQHQGCKSSKRNIHSKQFIKQKKRFGGVAKDEVETRATESYDTSKEVTSTIDELGIIWENVPGLKQVKEAKEHVENRALSHVAKNGFIKGKGGHGQFGVDELERGYLSKGKQLQHATVSNERKTVAVEHYNTIEGSPIFNPGKSNVQLEFKASSNTATNSPVLTNNEHKVDSCCKVVRDHARSDVSRLERRRRSGRDDMLQFAEGKLKEVRQFAEQGWAHKVVDRGKGKIADKHASEVTEACLHKATCVDATTGDLKGRVFKDGFAGSSTTTAEYLREHGMTGMNNQQNNYNSKGESPLNKLARRNVMLSREHETLKTKRKSQETTVNQAFQARFKGFYGYGEDTELSLDQQSPGTPEQNRSEGELTPKSREHTKDRGWAKMKISPPFSLANEPSPRGSCAFQFPAAVPSSDRFKAALRHLRRKTSEQSNHSPTHRQSPSANTKKSLRTPTENHNTIYLRYGEIPLSCLEDPKCCYRSHTMQEQAKHHSTTHCSPLPFFCLACLKAGARTAFQTKTALTVHEVAYPHKGALHWRSTRRQLKLEAGTTKKLQTIFI
eukprot:gene18163-19976_t